MERDTLEETDLEDEDMYLTTSIFTEEPEEPLAQNDDEFDEDIDLFELEDLFITYRDYNGCHVEGWVMDACEAIENADSLQKARQIYLSASASAHRKGDPGELAFDRIAGTWYMNQVVRLYFLTSLRKITPIEKWPDMLFDVYRQGDEKEKIVIIRALRWFGEGCDVMKVALDAGRANSVNLFRSLALENPYPAKAYQDDAFNRLVLKTLFLDLNIAWTVDLPKRCSPELSQLCLDLVNERLLANRQPPPSIWLAMRFVDLDGSGQDIWRDFLCNHSDKDNFYAAWSLLNHFPDCHSHAVQQKLLEQISKVFKRISESLKHLSVRDRVRNLSLKEKLRELNRQLAEQHKKLSERQNKSPKGQSL